MALLTKSEIDTLGVFLVNELSNELKQQGRVASKGLLSSIRFETKVTEGFTELSVYAADYAQFVDKGVKGNRSSSRAPKSPFKFKKKFPSGDFVGSLVGWIRARGLATGNKKIRDLAFAIGVSVLRHGIKPSNFIENTLKKAQIEINNKVEQMAIKKTEIEIDRIVKKANK